MLKRFREVLQNRASSVVIRHITSLDYEKKNRAHQIALAKSKHTGPGLPPAEVHYFHVASDPYSLLACTWLKRMAGWRIDLKIHLASPPGYVAAPLPEELKRYGLRDAKKLAEVLGMDVSLTQTPNEAACRAFEDSLAVLDQQQRCKQIEALTRALWQNPEASEAPSTSGESPGELARAEGDALRAKLRHYSGATFYYRNEWYWGLDRLHYLFDRLQEEGYIADETEAPPTPDFAADWRAADDTYSVHCYLSQRSPYSAVVASRVIEWCKKRNMQLTLVPVLPMRMRDLPVDRKKGLYIAFDTARESRRQGVSFGNAMDPLGSPVERVYTVLHAVRRVVPEKHNEAYRALIEAAWARRLNVYSPRVLRKVLAEIDVDYSKLGVNFSDESWRKDAQAGMDAMMSHDCWGVPTLQVHKAGSDNAEDLWFWGNDRLWVVDRLLAAQQ